MELRNMHNALAQDHITQLRQQNNAGTGLVYQKLITMISPYRCRWYTTNLDDIDLPHLAGFQGADYQGGVYGT
jgi:hypothetical protein